MCHDFPKLSPLRNYFTACLHFIGSLAITTAYTIVCCIVDGESVTVVGNTYTWGEYSHLYVLLVVWPTAAPFGVIGIEQGPSCLPGVVVSEDDHFNRSAGRSIRRGVRIRWRRSSRRHVRWRRGSRRRSRRRQNGRRRGSRRRNRWRRRGSNRNRRESAQLIHDASTEGSAGPSHRPEATAFVAAVAGCHATCGHEVCVGDRSFAIAAHQAVVVLGEIKLPRLPDHHTQGSDGSLRQELDVVRGRVGNVGSSEALPPASESFERGTRPRNKACPDLEHSRVVCTYPKVGNDNVG
mmetsp:Transcript_23344/g.68995  ORF Transcript_23344/g.68995 Transcript_23344/m.68995 type:complete len:294 (-) Transcript_23344:2755-3636(-)